MQSIEIRDRTRDSLAPYLPIPHGTRKLLGFCGGLLLFISAYAIKLCYRAYVQAASNVFMGAIFLGVVIALLSEATMGGDTHEGMLIGWFKAYWDRNWCGYKLLVFKVGEEYKYLILRPWIYPKSLDEWCGDDSPVLISIPLYGWTGVPNYWVKDAPLDPRPFFLRLNNRSFNGGWTVVVLDFFGNHLNLPVEMALELAIAQVQSTPALPKTVHHWDLSGVFLQTCEDWRLQSESTKFFQVKYSRAVHAIEEAIEMIRASTRFQRSKAGMEIREFLELRYCMLDNNLSEEQARAFLAKSA